MSEHISVLVVDDHRMFADALGRLLDSEPDISVAGVVASAEEALERASTTCPDVTLLDVDLPGMDGIAATSMLLGLCPQTQIVIITALRGHEMVARAVQAGASGFVSKARAADQLVEVIKRAAGGELVIPIEDLTSVVTALRDGQDAEPRPVDHLTPRERQILKALARSRSTAEIAADLGIAPDTVHGHVKSILAKLDVRSKLEAVLAGLRAGAISLEDVGDAPSI